MKGNSTKELKAIHSSDFKKYMNEWSKPRHVRFASDGCYSEGDEMHLPKTLAKIVLFTNFRYFFIILYYKS